MATKTCRHGSPGTPGTNSIKQHSTLAVAILSTSKHTHLYWLCVYMPIEITVVHDGLEFLLVLLQYGHQQNYTHERSKLIFRVQEQLVIVLLSKLFFSVAGCWLPNYFQDTAQIFLFVFTVKIGFVDGNRCTQGSVKLKKVQSHHWSCIHLPNF